MNSWKEVLEELKGHEKYQSLHREVSLCYEKGVCYPKKESIYRALELTPLKEVKVVILGQDPYHGENQADGLAFSVPEGEKLPPSLRNIYKELYDDLGIERCCGDLSSWAKQGVLLLNSSLSVEKASAGSHSHLGWQWLTDRLLEAVSREHEGVVFLLWGAHAQKKIPLIDKNRHQILTSVHPSPLSAYRGFFGSRPFSKINAILTENNKTPISW